MDAANIDLKAFTDDFYHKVCVGRLSRRSRHTRLPVPRDEVWLEVTTC